MRALAAQDGLEETIYDRTGQSFALAAGPRLLWLKTHRPDVYHRAATVLMLSEWVLFRLSGERVMEPSNGSTSGFVSLDSRSGDPELLRACGLRDDLLPRTFEPGTVVGDVTPSAAEETGKDETAAAESTARGGKTKSGRARATKSQSKRAAARRSAARSGK